MTKKDHDERVVNAIVRAINESQQRQGESHSKLTYSESLRLDAISVIERLGEEGFLIRLKNGISRPQVPQGAKNG